MRINNKNIDFYDILGPVFGSRKIQRITKDRFYDDTGKDWVINLDKSGQVISAISVKDHIIKNVYTEDFSRTIFELKELYAEVSSGKVPILYRDLYFIAGYQVLDESLNFITIKGGYHGRKD